MPDQLAANLTVGTLPVPTKHNPADAPSRDAPVRRRPAAPYPAWLSDLDSGDYSTWDERYGAARSALPACLFPVGTGAARYRAVGPPDELLGQAAGPPYDFAFQRNGLRRGDENSLIGDGPAGRREHSAPARTGDIRGPRGSTEHRAQRTAAFRKFEQWLESLGLPPNPVERLDGVTVGKLLVEYAQVQYARGAARNSVKLALLGVQDRYAHWRVALRSAWQTFSNFERETPGESHLPVPKVAYRASLGVCCAWLPAGAAREWRRLRSCIWLEMLASLIAGWLCMSRPGELLRLRRRNLGLPSDFGDPHGPGWIAFADPKGGWGRNAARAEHVTIRDPVGLRFLEAYAAHLPDDALLFPSLAVGTRHRDCWDAVFGRTLGFSCRDGVGLTPASLRAGALTALYETGQSPGRLQWEARHKDTQTTRRYVQELGAALVLARLPRDRRDAIESLARTAPPLLQAVTAELLSVSP